MNFRKLLLFLLCFFSVYESTYINYPTQWTKYTVSNIKASSCSVLDTNGDAWLCGGKSDITTNNTCQKYRFTSSGVTTLTDVYPLQKSSYVPGYYSKSNAFTCDTHNVGGYANGAYCFITIDGYDSPLCYCCSLDTVVSGQLRCQDLSLTVGCPNVYQGCVAYDSANNRLIGAGGSYVTTVNDTFRCLNISSQTWLPTSSCNFGTLEYAVRDFGCALVDSNKFVAVGGKVSSGASTDMIQVCEEQVGCSILPISLNISLTYTRVDAISSCEIAIFGGRNSSDSITNIFYVIDICNSVLKYSGTLPISLSEFSVVETNGVFCIVSGITQDGGTAKVSTSVYCTTSSNTRSPTTTTTTTRSPTKSPTLKPTTMAPTSKPTLKPTPHPTTHSPTARPTVSPTPAPTTAPMGVAAIDSIDVVYSWDQTMTSQSCASDGTNMFIMGGLSTSSSTAAFNTAYKFNSSVVMNKYTMQESIYGIGKSFPTFYCQHQCTATYNKTIYLYAPEIYSSGYDGNQVYFYKCSITDSSKLISCKNLCDSTTTLINFCTYLPFQPCVTFHDNYLFIAGGSISSSSKNYTWVFDMSKDDWYSVPYDVLVTTGYLKKYQSIYGDLPVAVHESGCSIWNWNLYVFGGKTGSEVGSIQICSPDSNWDSNRPTPCILSSAQLNVPRSSTQAQTLGASVSIVCGSTDNGDNATSVIEIYDIVNDKISIDSNSLDSSRKSCCVGNINNVLYITGGEAIESGHSVAIASVLGSEYSITESTTMSFASQEEETLYDCYTISVISSDGSFKGDFSRYLELTDYRIWSTDDNSAGIYFNKYNNDSDYQWIGNFTTSNWAYSSTLESGYWIKLATRKTRTSRITITLTCSDTATVKISKLHLIGGLNKAAFIAIIICACIIFLALVAFGIIVWKKGQNPKGYNLTSVSSLSAGQSFKSKITFNKPQDQTLNREDSLEIQRTVEREKQSLISYDQPPQITATESLSTITVNSNNQLPSIAIHPVQSISRDEDKNTFESQPAYVGPLPPPPPFEAIQQQHEDSD